MVIIRTFSVITVADLMVERNEIFHFSIALCVKNFINILYYIMLVACVSIRNKNFKSPRII